MATNCSDGIYNVHYTDINKNPITVNKKTINQGIVDLTLFGKSRKEYGENFDENLLHILENFAAIEDVSNPGNPDLTETYGGMLDQPSIGQKWYNKTQQKIYVYDGANWNPLSGVGDVAGNSGIIAHGEYLPLPVSAVSGYQFSYDECSWIVSMFNFPDQISSATCTTNQSGLVTSQYTINGSGTTINGYAFYQILGIRGLGTGVIPTPTPSPTPSITPTITVSNSVTPTITPSVTRTRTPIASATPSVTPSITRSVQASPTPIVSVTPSPTPSVTPSTSAPANQTLAINGSTYNVVSPIRNSGTTYSSVGSLSLNFNSDGTYTVTRTSNTNQATPFSGVWIPAGQTPSNYTLQIVNNITSQSNGTNGSATSSNGAASPVSMSTSHSLTLSVTFTYNGVTLPDDATGGTITSNVTMILTNTVTGGSLTATIGMSASTAAGL